MKQSKRRKPDEEDARDPARVRAVALRLLARREHSSRELTAKLTVRGYEQQTVAAVIEALVDRNLLSDTRFVDEFVASRLRRGTGPVKIREELRSRGVAESLVDDTLGDHRSEWLSQAETARRKRFGAALPKDFNERARQARFLQQRGYSAEHIRQVLKGDVELED
ncbi:MAG: regulatory protein RecX [Gammaproteobacteria bacterium]|nr:regulatory protein RecX [Gammaproteobacteria bacterium]